MSFIKHVIRVRRKQIVLQLIIQYWSNIVGHLIVNELIIIFYLKFYYSLLDSIKNRVIYIKY